MTIIYDVEPELGGAMFDKALERYTTSDVDQFTKGQQDNFNADPFPVCFTKILSNPVSESKVHLRELKPVLKWGGN
jgi:hypothetical protein